MFAGRHNELRKLNGIYNSGKFECVILYGRRRVGKTALAVEVAKNKRAVYFSAQETTARENLAGLNAVIDTLHTGGGSDTYEQALERLYQAALNERVVLIIDDYQNLAAAQKGISQLICSEIERRLKNTRLMLIICASLTPFIDNELICYDSPFYGKRTAMMRLEPFTFFEVRRYYGGFSPFDVAIIYGITGGVPRYLELMDPQLPVEENIRRSFFDTSSYIFEEPLNRLRQEVREPAYYNAVLKAIASGCAKNSEIASHVGLETSACTAYLKNLIGLGIVGKFTPIGESSVKKTIYEIEDNMFRFWYRFVPDNASLIRSGMADRIWRRTAEQIPVFMVKVFEDICRQWLVQQNNAGRLPIKFAEIGRWWGVDTVRRVETSLPVIAYADDEHAIFGECVWSDEPAGVESLVTLIERSELFRYRHRYLYLFARSGFSDECAEAAGRIGANLVMFE